MKVEVHIDTKTVDQCATLEICFKNIDLFFQCQTGCPKVQKCLKNEKFCIFDTRYDIEKISLRFLKAYKNAQLSKGLTTVMPP